MTKPCLVAFDALTGALAALALWAFAPDAPRWAWALCAGLPAANGMMHMLPMRSMALVAWPLLPIAALQIVGSRAVAAVAARRRRGF